MLALRDSIGPSRGQLNLRAVPSAIEADYKHFKLRQIEKIYIFRAGRGRAHEYSRSGCAVERPGRRGSGPCRRRDGGRAIINSASGAGRPRSQQTRQKLAGATDKKTGGPPQQPLEQLALRVNNATATAADELIVLIFEKLTGRLVNFPCHRILKIIASLYTAAPIDTLEMDFGVAVGLRNFHCQIRDFDDTDPDWSYWDVVVEVRAFLLILSLTLLGATFYFLLAAVMREENLLHASKAGLKICRRPLEKPQHSATASTQDLFHLTSDRLSLASHEQALLELVQ
ncbi:MAG: hypothetical protein Q9159_002412 [Coniocarpon cinnabarinum]